MLLEIMELAKVRTEWVIAHHLLTFPLQSHSGANLAATFVEMLYDLNLENKVRAVNA